MDEPKIEVKRHIFDPQFRLIDTLILASLSREPKHGYLIEAHVTNIGLGRIMPGNATVYKALKRLAADGMVAQLEPDPKDRRHFYDITPDGRAQLGRDLALMRRIIQAFEQRI